MMKRTKTTALSALGALLLCGAMAWAQDAAAPAAEAAKAWAPDTGDGGPRRVVRCQVVDVHGRAYLVTGEMAAAAPSWQVEAVYD